MKNLALGVGLIVAASVLGCGTSESSPTGGSGGGVGGAAGGGSGGVAGSPVASFCVDACTSPCLATIEASDPGIFEPGDNCVPACEADVSPSCHEAGTSLVSCLENNACADGPECEDSFFVFGECVAFADDPGAAVETR